MLQAEGLSRTGAIFVPAACIHFVYEFRRASSQQNVAAARALKARHGFLGGTQMGGLGTRQASALAIAGEQPLATQGDCMGCTGSLTQPLATSQHSCRAALLAALLKKVWKARILWPMHCCLWLNIDLAWTSHRAGRHCNIALHSDAHTCSFTPHIHTPAPRQTHTHTHTLYTLHTWYYAALSLRDPARHFTAQYCTQAVFTLFLSLSRSFMHARTRTHAATRCLRTPR